MIPRHRTHGCALQVPRVALAAAVASAAIVAGALALPPAAGAARDAELSLMDDQLLLGASEARVSATMRTLRGLGVDRLRVSAFWSSHAPAAKSRRRPQRFDATNPFDPAYTWSELDRVAAAAATQRIKLMISITTPAPIWATGAPGRRNPVYRPDPLEFARFAQAVASRYRFVADQYGLLNEPNQGAWLQPQSDRRGLVSPHLYRGLARAAYPRIKAADPDSLVLVGELASSGSDARGLTRPVRPLEFLRAMGCRTVRFRRLRRPRCRRFKPVPADAIGHHPYSFFAPPSEPSPNRDDAGIGDGRRLLATLDRLTARRAIVPSRRRALDVYYTEFGYQTDPPDPFAGIPLRRQDRYLQQAAYIVWRTPRVRAVNQFRLTDGGINRRLGATGFREFQSGLLFKNRRAKPAFRSFPHPFVAIDATPRRGRRLRLWGQARPGGAHRIVIEHRRRGGRRFRDVARLLTDGRGYFATRIRARSGLYRYRYRGAARGTSTTVRVRVG